MEKLTPMMSQYLDIKGKHQDCILFFRLGDFYEMFFDDAIQASKILDITLTGKSCGLTEKAPMCGVPYHSAQGYIQKLILAGKKVAMCEQIEDPSQAKGIVKREVVKIITPGTVIDEDIIDREKNNYLLSFIYSDNNFDISFAVHFAFLNSSLRYKLKGFLGFINSSSIASSPVISTSLL